MLKFNTKMLLWNNVLICLMIYMMRQNIGLLKLTKYIAMI
jgi:hypothetical protein